MILDGEHGVWFGIIFGQVIAIIVTTTWANKYIKRLINNAD